MLKSMRMGVEFKSPTTTPLSPFIKLIFTHKYLGGYDIISLFLN
jgi:hypothetical protein